MTLGIELNLLLSIPTKYVGNMTIALQSIVSALDSEHDVTLLIDDVFNEMVKLAVGPDARVLSYPRTQLSRVKGWQRVTLYFGFLKALRQTRYDAVLDLDGTVVSGRLVRVARSDRKIGPSFAKRPGVYHELVEIEQAVQHCFDDYTMLLESVGIPIKLDEYFYLPHHPDSESVLSRLNLDATRTIVTIHPSATKDYKQWRIDGFAKLCDYLTDKGHQVVVVGAGKSEEARVSQLMEMTNPSPVSAFNQLSIYELIALFQASDAFIGNDSGPMHLATACGTRVHAIFGPTELVRWHPKSRNVKIIRGPAPCSPDCQPEVCLRNYQCMSSLNPEHVIEALEIRGAHG